MLKQRHETFKRQDRSTQLIDGRPELTQIFYNDSAADLLQSIHLSLVQSLVWEEDATGALGASILSKGNPCLAGRSHQSFPKSLEASRVIRWLRQFKRPRQDLPELDVSEQLQQALRVSRKLGRCCVDEHFVPRLLMLMPSEDDRLSIRLWKEVRINVHRQSGRLLGGQERVKHPLCQGLGIDPQPDADLGTTTEGLKAGMRGI